MISALFDLINAIANGFFQVLGALVHIVVELLSAVTSAVLWPIRAAVSLLFGRWDFSTPWTNLYFFICGVLFLLLALLLVWTLWKAHKRRKGL